MEKQVVSPLKLKTGIIYGPVNSRRLGRSLGINLSPSSYKACSFNCVYCHYGWTEYLKGDYSEIQSDIPEPDEVRRVLEEVLKKGTEFDYITFSGNGEPTLHPQFDRIVNLVVDARDQYSPEKKVAILSNSSLLNKKEILEALGRIDLRIMKLDCGNLETFMRVNRPHSSVDYDKVIRNLADMEDIIIQTMLVDGEWGNTNDKQIKDWMDRVEEIKPTHVQLYSLENPPANESLSGLTIKGLHQIGEKTEQKTGVKVEIY